jgi:DNA-repair protein complementing XP-A cells
MVYECELCGGEQVDPELFAQFRVVVCYGCKDGARTETGAQLFALVSKTQAKADYLLTDEELADASLMPSISRKNPHNPHWSDMRLYLLKQVRDFALEKFGGEEGLQAAKAGRADTRVDRKSKKFLKALKELRSKTRVEKRLSPSIDSKKDATGSKSHHHVYLNGECTECGLKVQREEL